LAQAPATSATSSSATTLTAARTGSSARCSSSAPHCVEPTSSIRLSCARMEPFRRDRFCAPRRARRETRARPKLGRIDFDATETERSRVWSGPPKPVVGTHTGYKAAAGAGAPGPRSPGSGGGRRPAPPGEARRRVLAPPREPRAETTSSTVVTRVLRPCFENSTRAIEWFNNQPIRLRRDRAREL
jgi:hypothetical protein